MTYFVLANRQADGTHSFLALDFVHDSEVGGVPFYLGAEFMKTRQRQNELYVPRADIEFGSYLTRAIAKRALDPKQAERLAKLFLQDRSGCEAQIYRHWAGQMRKL